MGVLTLTQLLAEVRFDLRNRPDSTDSGISDTRLTLYLNAAYRHLCHPSVHRHRELLHTYTLPLVSGTNTYTFTPDPASVNIVAVRSVTYIDSPTYVATATKNKLKPVEAQWFDERTLTADSRPNQYMLEGSILEVSPVPGANEDTNLLRVRAIKEPALLAGAVTTEVSGLWDEVLIMGARWRAEMHLGYRDLAEATKLDYGAMLNEYQTFSNLQAEDWDWVPEFRMDPGMEHMT